MSGKTLALRGNEFEVSIPRTNKLLTLLSLENPRWKLQFNEFFVFLESTNLERTWN